MSFNITFDSRFDSTGFFNDPARRAALEAAGDAWESVIGDEFADIPAGTRFSVLNPSTRSNTETVTTTKVIDDLIVFVGAMDIGSLGIAGPDGYDADGDVLASRISSDFRGQGPVTDFEPWAGTITFDSTAAWSFDLAGPVAGRDDFLSVAIHEIGHVLGIGTSGAFDALVTWGQFTGVNAYAVNGGSPVPLHSDDSHVEEDYAGGDVAMDPTLTSGNRKLLSDIDKAILADIGYKLTGFTPQGSQPEIATENGEIIFGTIHADAIETANTKFAGPNVKFRVSDTDRLPLADESIDTIISYDVFEHVATPAQILSECHRVLRPGGSMLIGTWGWYHPFAPHLWSVMPVPWAHVLFSERIMLRVCRRIYQTDWYQPNMHDFDENGERIPDKFNYESIPTDYLNKFLIRDFERTFQQSEFDFQIHPERFSSRAAAWTKPLLRVPVLKEFFTSYIWCVLSKPGKVQHTPSARISTAPERPVPQPSSCP